MPHNAVTDWHEEGVFITVTVPGFSSKAEATAFAKQTAFLRLDREQGKASLSLIQYNHDVFPLDPTQVTFMLEPSCVWYCPINPPLQDRALWSLGNHIPRLTAIKDEDLHPITMSFEDLADWVNCSLPTDLGGLSYGSSYQPEPRTGLMRSLFAMVCPLWQRLRH